MFRPATRILDLPPYLFAELDRKVSEKRDAGADVISFGVGDPDFATPPHVVEALQKAAEDPSTHHYPSYFGLPELRETIAEWCAARFGVALDPSSEIIPLWGSKEGIAHLPLALVDPGDVALCTDPGYPVYATTTLLAGGEPFSVPCPADRGWAPDLDAIPSDVVERAKILWLNYPGNPTAATVGREVFEQAVEWCRRHRILLAHDAAYSEITYDGYRAPSVLEVDGAKEVAVEFHSLSKTFNMTGWRIGWMCGSPEAVEALSRLKTNLDSGVFNAVQRAAIAALTGPMDFLDGQLGVFAGRRDRTIEALRAGGLDPAVPKGSFYVWCPVPDGHTSTSFATRLLDEAAVVVAPGNGYGAMGEGYVRFALTLADDRVDEGLERVRRVLS